MKMTTDMLGPLFAERLRAAKGLDEIDKITDELATRGIVRERTDVSMFRVNDPLPKNIWASTGGKNGGAA